MTHQEAVLSAAAEKYVLRTLDETSRDAFEDHFFACEECAEAVRILMAITVAAGEHENEKP